jgi:hypothetical protein
LRIDYPQGGQVRIYGSDNEDSLRGIYLDGVNPTTPVAAVMDVTDGEHSLPALSRSAHLRDDNLMAA